MRTYNTAFSFIDFLFILLTGFIALLLLAFLLINPIAKDGKIDPKTEMMITIEWPENSILDIDLWIKGPNNTIVSYQKKDGAYIILERDDLGKNNDKMLLNGELVVIQRNVEVGTINQLFPGEYIINIHNYTSSFKQKLVTENNETVPVPVTVQIYKMNPFNLVYKTTTNLDYREEKTILTFVIDEKGRISDKRTDLFIPLYKDRGPP